LLLFHLWVCALIPIMAGCGGKLRAEETRDVPIHAPVRVGPGVYEVSARSLFESCDPPFFVGDFGPEVALVGSNGKTIGANVPVCEVSSLGNVPSCSWSNLEAGRAFEFTREVRDDCEAKETMRQELVDFDGTNLQVRYTRTLTGLSGCPASTSFPKADCISDRVFHYRWVRACEGEFDILDPSTCID
jgi:hypothetical protein